ncbi:MHYT domain-containing protein [Polymorphum gilvum]|uniref:Carbon monoxide dehydrogenase operon C protein n=1 Tax=Polymorphum gilvum (strain LMG 25793 / CGMCC 1.9160 / SL003B-26A1) TaxID=991905 RepID=F2IW54_POLGS|nr:MHYT domain-containing protein [Polymorphum gilvum]ADZ71440.1 Carbon monoxide dehydrogenase operon C protein [Polymorphum gilvum SL003B-26A1]
MSLTHEPWLVALSLIVAFQGSYVGLSIAVQVTDAVDPRRRYLLAGAALSLALGIWSMHFVGMLAARLPVAVDFLVLPTLLSFLVCVLVVGLSVFAASNGPLGRLRLSLSAFVMGTGICTMHYLGMYALHASSRMDHDPRFVGASFVVAFAASGLALWLAFGAGRRPPVLISAAVLGGAISAMHYIAMAGMTLTPHSAPQALSAPAVGPGTLAIIVAIVAFVVSGLFLLALVPERGATRAPSAHRPAGRLVQNGGGAADLTEQTDVAALAAFADLSRAQDASGNAALAEPLRRAALGLQGAPEDRLRTGSAGKSLPIERDGVKARLAIDDLLAVQADAHYTRLYDSSRSYFCPLSIGEVERQLDSKLFARVHRSHIVNLSRVAGLRRAGDSGLLHMACEEPHAVPVSRSKWSRIKARIAALDTAPPAAAAE